MKKQVVPIVIALVFLILPMTYAVDDSTLRANLTVYERFENIQNNGVSVNNITLYGWKNGSYSPNALGSSNTTGKLGNGWKGSANEWTNYTDGAFLECGTTLKNCSIAMWMKDTQGTTPFGRAIVKLLSYQVYMENSVGQATFELNTAAWTSPNIPITNNTWHFFVFTYGPSNISIYKDGVMIQSNTSFNTALADNGNPLLFGNGGTLGSQYLRGVMDEAMFWYDRVLVQEDVSYLYNSGAGRVLGFTEQGSILTIRAQNIINSTYIAGICANATNGTDSASSCNSTGTMVMFNQSQVFGTVNITVFNVTHHYNATSQNYAFTTTSSKDVPVWQSWVELTASRAYIGSAISTFNATNGGATNQTTTGTLYLPANNGTQNISVGVNGNYTETYLVTPTNIYTTIAYEADNTYDAKYNFTAFALNTQAGIQTFTTLLTNSLFTNQNRTTAAYKTVHTTLQGYSHTATLQAAGYAYQNTTFTTSNAWGAYNFTVYTTNSINISFYDEMNDNLLSGMLVSLEYIGTYQSGNTTTLSGHIYLDLLTPDSYILRYNAPDYTTRFYDFTLYNNTFSRLNLTLLNTSEDGNQNVTVTVKDNLDNFIPNAVVKLYKYDVTTNTYDLISTRNTNFQGKTVFDILVDREFYKFIVEYEGEVVLTTSPSYIYGTSITLIIDLITGSGFTPAITNSRISGQIVFINASNTLAFTYNDASNTASQGCLYVYRLSNTGRTIYNQTCSTTPSGTVYAVVERLNNTAYIAEGKVEDSGGAWHLVTSYTLVFDNPMPDSQENLFFMFIIMAVFALIGIWKIEVSILLASSVPLLFSMAQLSRLGYFYTVPIFVLGLVFAWVVARR